MKVTVAVLDGTPLYGVPVMVTVNVPLGNPQVSVEVIEETVELSVMGVGCRLQV